MNAMILAAGDGSRMGSIVPKVLLSIHEVPLIQRTIFTLKEAGITEMIVVIGFKGDLVKNQLGDGAQFGVKIRYVENTQYERENATSILVGENLVDDEFLLLMGDHMFSQDMIRRILRIKGGFAVIVDSNPKYVDVQEATKVLVDEGAVKDIGKGLEKFNAVEAGIFLCSKQIFPTVRRCLRRGEEEWADCIKEYSKNHKVIPVDASSSTWIDIDTKEDVKIAEEILMRTVIKPDDGFISRSLNRKISSRISRYLLRTKITPVQMTVLSFLIALFSAISFSFGSYIFNFIGGVAAQVASILDGCDGEIARLKLCQSSYGAWLDASLDRYADFLIILGVIWGCWRVHSGVSTWILGILSIGGSFMMSYTRTRFKEAFHGSLRYGKFSMKRDVRVFILFISGILNQTYFSLILLAVLTNLEVGVLLIKHRSHTPRNEYVRGITWSGGGTGVP